MKVLGKALAVVVLLVACGKDKDGRKGGGNKSAPKQMTIAEVLGSSKKASLIGPFASAKFGMTEDELKKAVPLYADKGDYLSPQDFGIGFYAYTAGPPADESAKKNPKRFTSIIVSVKDADVNAIKAAWGEPVTVEDRGKPVQMWHNADDKIRATLEPGTDKGDQKLQIEPYLPAKWILGEPGKPLGIEDKRAFIGSTAAELEAAYPANYDRTLDTLSFMKWDSDEYGDRFQMELGMKDGKVKSLQYWISHGKNPKVMAEMKALIEAKYGVAKEVKREYLGPENVMSENPKATLKDTGTNWVIEVGYD